MTLYIATSNPGKLRDFAAVATPAHLDQPHSPTSTKSLPPSKTNPPSKATPGSRPSTTPATLPAQSSSPTTPASKSTPSTARPASAPPATPKTTTSPVRPLPSPDERNNLYLLQALNNIPEARPPGPLPLRPRRSPRRQHPLAPADGTVEGQILTALAAQTASATTLSSISPNTTRPWPNSTSHTKLAFSHRGRAFARLARSSSLKPA